MEKNKDVPAVRGKTIPAAKLPALLKKSYTQKQFEKKILKHLYIEQDREQITGLFRPDSSGRLSIPENTVLPRNDFRHLKQVARQIGKQKGRIKLVPLLAVCLTMAAAGITVTVFKNSFAKYAITRGMETAFGAETDVGSVRVQLFGASLEVRNLVQADKNRPMKNLFQVANVTLDFNLTELLRGKFDAQQVEITGIAFGTDRKKSGELPGRQKQQTSSGSEFKKLTATLTSAAAEKAKSSLQDVFRQYEPQNIIGNLQDSLKSPQVAQDVQKKVEELTPQWKSAAANLESSVTSFSSDVQAVLSTDWSKTDNAADLARALETVTKAAAAGKSLKEKTEAAAGRLKTDSATVRRLSDSLRDAVKSDNARAEAELAAIQSFTLDDGKKLISASLDSVTVRMLGTYYPYVKLIVALAGSMKKGSSPASAGKVRKNGLRAAGRTIYYKTDTVPAFLIEKAVISGTGFSASAQEVSSDQDLRGSPAVCTGELARGKTADRFRAVVDARSDTKAPLVSAEYTGGTVPVSVEVPTLSLKGSAGISVSGTADSDGSFTVKSTISMDQVQLGAEQFGPEFAYELYKKALAGISRMTVAVDAAYKPDTGLAVDTSSDADRQLVSSLRTLVNSELAAVRQNAEKEIAAVLARETAGASEKILEYSRIENTITRQNNAVSEINRKLQTTESQIQAALQKKTGKAVEQSVRKTLKSLF